MNLSETIEKYTNKYTITFGEIMEKLSHEYTLDKNVEECHVCWTVEEIVKELLKKLVNCFKNIIKPFYRLFR